MTLKRKGASVPVSVPRGLLWVPGKQGNKTGRPVPKPHWGQGHSPETRNHRGERDRNVPEAGGEWLGHRLTQRPRWGHLLRHLSREVTRSATRQPCQNLKMEMGGGGRCAGPDGHGLVGSGVEEQGS